jgi:hypothetical protein
VAEFDPRQLDQLEDALEVFEDLDDLASLELSPELTERLSDYRDVLELCRDAFPDEDPDDDVLAGVLAEAREVSRRPRLRDADRDSGWRRFWERWRGTVVPGFALAATAAAVLWFLDPGDSSNAKLAEFADKSAEKADQKQDGELERTQPASEPRDSDADDEPEPEPDDEAAPEIEPDDDGGDDEPTPEPKARKRKASGGDEMVAEPEPAPEPMTKQETWSSFGQADAARRTGDCDRARQLYEDIIAASSDSLAVARSKAGIGLCYEQERRDTEAAKWYSDARASGPGIDAWIAQERDEQPMPGEIKKKRKAKASPKSKKDALDL